MKLNIIRFPCSLIHRYSKKCYHIEHDSVLKSIVGVENIITDKSQNEAYFTDWTGSFSGGSTVCFPRTTEEVSKLLKYCNANKISVVPQGGNTGLVGGAVGLNQGKELILSLKRMNTIIDIDVNCGVLVSEAGCLLEDLEKASNEAGFTVPLDLGSKGSCMIGGNVSTNAGGLRVLKYGSLHKNILGLEVVLPDGSVLDMLRTLHKDNCGYPLKHIFIGAEGTLGVVTKVCMSLAVLPSVTHVIFSKVSAFSKVQSLLVSAKRHLGDSLSAFEFIDSSSLNVLQKISPHLFHGVQPSVLPLALTDANANTTDGIPGEVCVLLEIANADIEMDNVLLERFMERIIDDGAVVDAVISQDSAQEKALWNIRETVPISLMQRSRERGLIDSDTQIDRKLFKYDISLSLADTDQMILTLKLKMAERGFLVKNLSISSNSKNINDEFGACELDFCNFGHAGDQNLHLNILAAVVTRPSNSHGSPSRSRWIEESELSTFLSKVHSLLNDEVFRLVVALRGSISAEHGVGQQKRDVLKLVRSVPEMQLMHALKRTIDPNGIMNPNKVLVSDQPQVDL